MGAEDGAELRLVGVKGIGYEGLEAGQVQRAAGMSCRFRVGGGVGEARESGPVLAVGLVWVPLSPQPMTAAAANPVYYFVVKEGDTIDL